ncbi:MAG: hypothetical protein IJ617_03790 [Oscillospiraceae bacterium]|nr:hypothetical protein [Oscillospiraceae bacterium]
MEAKTEKLSVTGTDLRLGLGLILALLLAHFLPAAIQPLSAGTAVIMCTQDNARFTWKSGLTRLEGVVIGGVIALLVVLADNAVQSAYLFILLCGIGVVLNLLCCRLVRMPGVVARVSCITFALVTLATTGEVRFKYAALRVLGTAAGALIALGVAWLWDRCFGKKQEAAQI